jgi:hypothetical protein
VRILLDANKSFIIVHEQALQSCNSRPLNALLNAEWIEAKNQEINWTEHDSSTVLRFATFIYQNDYDAPNPQPLATSIEEGEKDENADVGPTTDEEAAETPSMPEPEPEPAQGVEPEQEQEQGQIVEITGWPKEESSVMQNIIADSYKRPLTPVDENFLAGLPQQSKLTEAGVFGGREFPYHSNFYVDVLLAHAKVYAFALSLMFDSLQELALQRLNQTLTRIDCRQPHAASEVATLIEHIYSGTGHSREDPARKLVSQFAALHFDDLVHGEFEDLLHDGNDFVTDVMLKVARRLSSDALSIKRLEDQLNDAENKIRELERPEEPEDVWGAYGMKSKKKLRG